MPDYAIRSGLLALLAGVFFPVPGGAQEAKIADFSGLWARTENTVGRMYHPPPDGGPGPVMDVPEAGAFRIGDHTNPILRPHTAQAVKAHGDRGRAGEVVLPSWSLCWPAGVPLVLNMGEPVQFLQGPDQITIIYRRDMQVRRIYLNDGQPEDREPSWYGSSVGHYEGPNTLVVETRAQNDRAFTDRYGSPRSEEIRVVERYTVNDDRSELHVEFMVEDPEMFTVPWRGNVTYLRTAEDFNERICAENNKDPDGGMFPIPIDDSPDF